MSAPAAGRVGALVKSLVLNAWGRARVIYARMLSLRVLTIVKAAAESRQSRMSGLLQRLYDDVPKELKMVSSAR